MRAFRIIGGSNHIRCHHIRRYIVAAVFLATQAINGSGILMAQATTLTINADHQR